MLIRQIGLASSLMREREALGFLSHPRMEGLGIG